MPGKLEVSFNSPQCGWMSIGFARRRERISHDDRPRSARGGIAGADDEYLTALADPSHAGK